ncbi:hypothetical protein RGU70_10060 [Herbaspirillum sp. RTI4]|uniref:hypothetical protein n=1 Tax=Herbaspirillum sp. RTI4 TaxID=3048640 RepID=UPI002AB3D374|nr:hypothetical protein [Herbaspirillum sp. RTI4]MDY7578666.1 hypothetical protein [Herbaspirillum sp. RTI4]MEA9980636.1 hypothetical protein [Herbaspirillum sp. RTI4]
MLHPLQPVIENRGLHEVIAELEASGLSPALEQQLEKFTAPFLEPLATHLSREAHSTNGEAEFADMLRQTWSVNFPTLPPDLLAGLHAAYNEIAEARGHKTLESGPDQIGRALLSLLAQKIAGELCLLLAHIHAPQLASLPQLRSHFHAQVEYAPGTDTKGDQIPLTEMRQAIRLLKYEMESMAQTKRLTARAASDASLTFRELLLQQVCVALREGPYCLEQLLPPDIPTLKPQRPRDWGLVFLCASTGIAPPASRTAHPSPHDAASSMQRMYNTMDRMRSSAASLWSTLPTLPHLPVFPPLVGALHANSHVQKRAPDSLQIFLTEGIHKDAGLTAIYEEQRQSKLEIFRNMHFVPDDFPKFMHHPWVLDQLSKSAVEPGWEDYVSRAYSKLIRWHRNTALEQKADTLQIDTDNADDWKAALKTDWYHNGMSFPPLASLAHAIRSDGLNTDNLSELFSLAHYGPKLFQIEDRQQEALRQWAVRAWKIYRSQAETANLDDALGIIRSSATYFNSKTYGYDQFYPFHQYALSHAGFGHSHCLPTALLYLSSGGDHAIMENMRDNLGRAAQQVQDTQAFQKYNPLAVIPGLLDPINPLQQGNLDKARFIAASFHSLYQGAIFRDESKFDSHDYLKVSTPQEVIEHVRNLPVGMHALFHQHAIKGLPIGHTCVLRVAKRNSDHLHYYLFDPTFGEFHFRDVDSLSDFIRHATTPNIAPPFFYFPDLALKAISIVPNADKLLQERLLLPRFDILRETLPQLKLPFDQMKIVPEYEAAFLPASTDMGVFDSILLMPDTLPPAIRQAIPDDVVITPDEPLQIKLTQTRCLRGETPCSSGNLEIKDTKGVVLHTITDMGIVANYRRHRMNFYIREEIQWLFTRAILSDRRLSSGFSYATERVQLNAEYARLISVEVHEGIELYQHTQEIAQSIQLHAPKQLTALRQFYASAIRGNLPTTGWQAAPEFQTALKWMNAPAQPAQHAYRRMTLFSKLGALLTSVQDFLALLGPDVPKESPEYILQQLSRGRASTGLIQPSSHALNWAMSLRLQNLSPTQLGFLTKTVADSASNARNLVLASALPSGMKAALARNLAVVSAQVPGALQYSGHMIHSGLEFIGNAALGANTAISMVNMGFYANQLQHTSDPDRYTAVSGKLTFSVLDASTSLTAMVAYGAGVAGMASGLSLFVMFIGTVAWLVDQLHFDPLEQRAGLRLVNQTLTEVRNDYRAPLDVKMYKHWLKLDFNLVEIAGTNATRHRWNSVGGIDLSRIGEGKIGVKAGNATIASPTAHIPRHKTLRDWIIESRTQFVIPTRRVIWNPVKPDLNHRLRLAELSQVADWQWLDVPLPRNATHIVLYAPDGKADADISWSSGSLYNLEDQDLHGPFPGFPLLLKDGNHITQLSSELQTTTATRIVAGGKMPLVCFVMDSKPVQMEVHHHICTLIMRPNAKASVTGILLPGSAIILGDDDAAPVFGLGKQTVHWEGDTLHVATARIDLSAARAAGPLMVILRGVQYLLHPTNNHVNDKNDFPLAGAKIRLSHVDSAKLPEQDDIILAKQLNSYGYQQFGAVNILYGLCKERPELFPLPVHILDANNATYFYDAEKNDLFSPQAVGWRGHSFELMVKKSGLGGPLWLIRNDAGDAYTTLRKKAEKHTAHPSAPLLPPEIGSFATTNAGENYRLKMKVIKVWQAGEVVKFLSAHSLIYSLAPNGKPLLCGAKAEWWRQHFMQNNDYSGLASLKDALPAHVGWLHLNLPRNEVLHVDTEQRVAFLTATEDVYPVQYIRGTVSGVSPSLTLQRLNQTGSFEQTHIDVSQIAHTFAEFTTSSEGVAALPGKTAYLQVPPPADWKPTLPADSGCLIGPGPHGLGMLWGITASFVERLSTKAQPLVALGTWLSEQLQTVAVEANVELAPALSIEHGKQRLIFHVRTHTMAMVPQGSIMIAHDEHLACFYRFNDTTLHSSRFQSLEGLHATDLSSLLSHLNQTSDAPPFSLTRFNATLQDATIVEDSLQLTTQDGRVLEFPIDLNFPEDAPFTPCLIRIAPHWFTLEKIASTDTVTINRTLKNYFANDPRYAATSVLVADVIAIGLPVTAGAYKNGFYLPERGQYIAPPSDLPMSHANGDLSGDLFPVNIALAEPYSLWKRGTRDHIDGSWYFITDGVQWSSMGKLDEVEMFGESGDRSFMIMPSNEATEGTLGQMGENIRHYVVWRNRPIHRHYALYLHYTTLPLSNMSIWLLGNGGQTRSQHYSLVVSEHFSLIPGSLIQTKVSDDSVIFTADLRDRENNTLQLRFTELGPLDQVTVQRGLDHRQRETLLVASGSNDSLQ